MNRDHAPGSGNDPFEEAEATLLAAFGKVVCDVCDKIADPCTGPLYSFQRGEFRIHFDCRPKFWQPDPGGTSP